MATRLKNLDRNTPLLLPPDLRDWIPGTHIVHFLIDAVDRLPAEDRIKNLERARSIIEERYEKERQQKQAEYEEKKATRWTCWPTGNIRNSPAPAKRVSITL